ncbi:unnamed protein product [Sphagnum jensenii]
MTWEENQNSGEEAFEQGRYAEAERFFVVAIQEAESLADDQVKLADSLYFLGKVYTLFEEFPKAESALTKALAIRGKALGTENAKVAEVIEQLGTLYLNERKYEQSEPMLKRSLDMRLKLFGENSAEVACSMAALGALNTSKNLLRDAEALLRKSLAIQEEKLGPNDKELAATLGLLALCRMRRKDYLAAEGFARRALEIRSAIHGMEHPNVAMTLHILASTCMAQAEELFRRLETLTFAQPQYCKEWCDAVRYQAQMYVMKRQFEDGEHYIYRALDQFEQAEIDNEDCKSALIKSLVRCHLGQKKFVDAAREVPAIASMTMAKAIKKLESTQSVATIKELVGGLRRRSSTVESDN